MYEFLESDHYMHIIKNLNMLIEHFQNKEASLIILHVAEVNVLKQTIEDLKKQLESK